MARSVTIRIPEDGEDFTGDFTAEGAVCPRMEPVELILDSDAPVTVSSADGLWSHDFTGVSSGNHTLVARQQNATSVSHTVDFTVTVMVSTAKPRSQPRPSAKAMSRDGKAKKSRKRRMTV